MHSFNSFLSIRRQIDSHCQDLSNDKPLQTLNYQSDLSFLSVRLSPFDRVQFVSYRTIPYWSGISPFIPSRRFNQTLHLSFLSGTESFPAYHTDSLTLSDETFNLVCDIWSAIHPLSRPATDRPSLQPIRTYTIAFIIMFLIFKACTFPFKGVPSLFFSSIGAIRQRTGSLLTSLPYAFDLNATA